MQIKSIVGAIAITEYCAPAIPTALEYRPAKSQSAEAPAMPIAVQRARDM
jgi:hypothetical protein